MRLGVWSFRSYFSDSDSRTSILWCHAEADFSSFSPCSDFTFEGIRLGNAVFDVDYKHLKNQASIQITNRNDFSIALELEVISDGEAFCATETISSKNESLWREVQLQQV